MGKCGGRTLMYVVTALQLISTAERQIFDFLGFMWLPIAGNFLNTIFVILGIFGIYQYHTNYILAYLFWTLLWTAWNAFIVCFYLEVGHLDRERDLLSFNTGSYSWWLVNGFGCEPDFFANDTSPVEPGNAHHPPRPKVVNGCLLEYEYVEVTHACVQLLLAILGMTIGSYLAYFFITVVDRKRKSMTTPKNMYSIEYSPQINENTSSGALVANGDANRGHMTPRRVKRRSYTRSSSRSVNRMAANSNQKHHQRSSTRSYSRNKSGPPMNPVNRLLDDQHRHQRNAHSVLNHGVSSAVNGMDSSTSNDDTRHAIIAAERCYGQINPGFQSSRPNSLVYSVNNEVSQEPSGVAPAKNVQSVTDYEASRPPSALTSYSNFHGQRRANAGPQSLPMNNLTQESINQQQQQRQQLHNNSFDDDLPPPPPPLSSSPTPQPQSEHMLPVPLQRLAPARRSKNEYVNMPLLSQQQAMSSSSPDSSLQQPNYANAPEASCPPPPLVKRAPAMLPSARHPAEERYDDAQTLRADDNRLQQFRQISIDYDPNSSSKVNQSAEPQSRVPNGNQRRDNRSSLRAKHRRDMEDKVKQRQPVKEDDYGFANGGASGPLTNGDASNGDKWYLQDSMRPVGAPQHGGNCKCYRCQRKLTAI